MTAAEAAGLLRRVEGRDMAGHRLGIVIGAGFGLVYVLVNARVLASPVGPALQVLGLVGFAAVLIRLFRADPTVREGGGRRGAGIASGYWLVVVAEVVAVAVGNLVLNKVLDLPLAVLPWTSFVVGLHFVGLAKVWGEPSLSWLGAVITALGALGLLLASVHVGREAIALTSGVGPGTALLVGSWWGARARLDQARF
jgi:hypothetical protein